MVIMEWVCGDNSGCGDNGVAICMGGGEDLRSYLATGLLAPLLHLCVKRNRAI